MTNRLVQLASTVDELPTLDQIDAMLAEMSGMDRTDQASRDICDELIEMRDLLSASGPAGIVADGSASDHHPGPADPG